MTDDGSKGNFERGMRVQNVPFYARGGSELRTLYIKYFFHGSKTIQTYHTPWIKAIQPKFDFSIRIPKFVMFFWKTFLFLLF
jgi:hypothetical protein